MQNKLQELTDRLYNEGLSKGKEEGEQILSEAKAKADKIIADAQAKAEAIMEDARKSAADLEAKAKSDIASASQQTLQATRKDIEDLIVAKIADKKVTDALSSGDFLKEVIKAVAEKFSATESKDISLVLPESLKADLEPFVKGELSKQLSGKVEASFSKKIAGGFTIAPKDGGWFISLTDDTFKSLICEYLRPVTRKLLFG